MNIEAKSEDTGATEMQPAIRELADLAMKYPFRWFTQGKVARLCGFGEDMLSEMAAHGAPIVGRKCNPHLLHKWMEKNIGKVAKLRPIH